MSAVTAPVRLTGRSTAVLVLVSLIGLALFSLVIGAAFRYAVGLGIFVVAVVRLKSQD